MTTSRITAEKFSRLVGTAAESLPKECLHWIDSTDFSYEELAGDERDRALLQILKRILEKDLPRSGQDRQPQWESGWSENLGALEMQPQNLSCLRPHYYRKAPAIRFSGKLIRPHSESFEFDIFCAIRSFVTAEFLEAEPITAIYEFGCGPCHNLAYFAEKFPHRTIVGLDWAPASQKITELLRQRRYPNIQGRHFDFFKPDMTMDIASNSAIITFGAFEQLGEAYQPMLSFLLEKRPRLVVNIEPVHEFYNPDDFMDYLALCYHNKRNYLQFYYTKLKNLLSEKKITKLHARRIPVGGLYHEGWNLLAWAV